MQCNINSITQIWSVTAMPGIPFSLRLNPQIKAALDAQAKLENRSAASVLQQAATDYLRRQSQIRDMVIRLEKEADRGEYVSEDAMTAWFLSLGTENELPEPEVDVFLHGS